MRRGDEAGSLTRQVSEIGGQIASPEQARHAKRVSGDKELRTPHSRPTKSGQLQQCPNGCKQTTYARSGVCLRVVDVGVVVSNAKLGPRLVVAPGTRWEIVM